MWGRNTADFVWVKEKTFVVLLRNFLPPSYKIKLLQKHVDTILVHPLVLHAPP